MTPTTGWTRPVPEPTNFSRPFWDAANEGRLVIQYCRKTGKFQHYPRPVSIYTGGRETEWREVTGRGVIYTFTITRRPPRGFSGPEPYVVATVQLDEGVRFLSNIVNCPVENIRIGMRVRVTWDRINAEFNYPVFEPDGP